MVEGTLADLFCGSPFSATASEESARCWAAREDVLQRLRRIVHALSTRPDSSLDVMWANLGAGKTHAMQHFRLMLLDKSPRTVVVYVEFPEQVRSFTEIYKRIASKLLQTIRLDELLPGDTRSSTDLDKAARTVAYGDALQSDIALQWFVGGNPSLKDLKNLIGISHRVDNDLAATDVLNDVVQRLRLSDRRLVILADEFQRLGTCKPANRASILSSFRTIFSANSTHFSIMLAAASSIERTALDLLSPELRTIAGLRPSITLPEFDVEESHDFLRGRFSCFRPPGYAADPLAPFGANGVTSIIQALVDADRRLIPRTLLQATGRVYDEIDFQGLSHATPDIIQEALGNLEQNAL